MYWPGAVATKTGTFHSRGGRGGRCAKRGHFLYEKTSRANHLDSSCRVK